MEPGGTLEIKPWIMEPITDTDDTGFIIQFIVINSYFISQIFITTFLNLALHWCQGNTSAITKRQYPGWPSPQTSG